MEWLLAGVIINYWAMVKLYFILNVQPKIQIFNVMFTFAASRTSGEVQHNFGDTSLHSRFGSQHFGRFPAICGLKNVMLPETSESLKIWRGSEEYKQVLLLHPLKICPFCSERPWIPFLFSCISWCSESYLIFTII